MNSAVPSRVRNQHGVQLRPVSLLRRPAATQRDYMRLRMTLTALTPSRPVPRSLPLSSLQRSTEQSLRNGHQHGRELRRLGSNGRRQDGHL